MKKPTKREPNADNERPQNDLTSERARRGRARFERGALAAALGLAVGTVVGGAAFGVGVGDDGTGGGVVNGDGAFEAAVPLTRATAALMSIAKNGADAGGKDEEELAAAERRRAEKDETARRELDQLEFQLARAKSSGGETVSELSPLLEPLAEEASRLAEDGDLSPEIAERARSVAETVERFRRFVVDSDSFFRALRRFDAASLDADATRRFLGEFFAEFSDSPEKGQVVLTRELEERFLELKRVAALSDALATLDDWNAFVDAFGARLERFYLSPEAAEAASSILARRESTAGFPSDVEILARRASEIEFARRERVPIRRKILLALDAESSPKYWAFAPEPASAPDKIVYLTQPPRAGRNVRVVDATGKTGTTEIPPERVELARTEAAQPETLRELVEIADKIPESLRAEDVGRWYSDWSAFLKRLQGAKTLDPIVRFRLLRTSVRTLAAGDYFFARRLEPIVRMLDLPALDDDSPNRVDKFQTENPGTQAARRAARARLDYLPNDYLDVVKTTAQLDASVPKFAFVYRRVGWLDRDFSGAWRVRRPDDAPLPTGDLFVLRVDESGDFSAGSGGLGRAGVPRWFKIGTSDGKTANLDFAATNVWRGSLVFCRTRDDADVAERRDFERYFRR